jgi:hypothetical protein
MDTETGTRTEAVELDLDHLDRLKSPWAKWESWTTSIVMSDHDARPYVDNFATAISR